MRHLSVRVKRPPLTSTSCWCLSFASQALVNFLTPEFPTSLFPVNTKYSLKYLSFALSFWAWSHFYSFLNTMSVCLRNEKCPHRLRHWKTWSPVGTTVWRGYGESLSLGLLKVYSSFQHSLFHLMYFFSLLFLLPGLPLDALPPCCLSGTITPNKPFLL